MSDFESVKYVHSTGENIGGIDSSEGKSIQMMGTESIFNPFYVFRYSKYSTVSTANAGAVQGSYKVNKHKHEYSKSLIPVYSDDSEYENPTATAIIEWTRKKADDKGGPLYPYPYQLNDFLWCKWYGKIPNNRLLTLRRYPIPVEDNLKIADSKLPLVPTAQAVTWWGGDTNNTLSNILGLTYGFNWTPKPATLQDVTGNEIKADDILREAGLNPNSKSSTMLKSGLLAPGTNPLVYSGGDKKLQDYYRKAWDQNGPYWNRVRGPVNVINSTQIRTEGLDFKHEFTLTFEYNLRSYGNINPKIAMIDLISNFLSLTYSSAPFWGGGVRYFKQTGYVLPAFDTTNFEEGHYVDGISEVAMNTASILKDRAASLSEFIKANNINMNSNDDKYLEKVGNELKNKIASSSFANSIIGSKMSSLMQNPLVMRSFLDGRAVGEWHLMVGNPISPIAVIGNLCLKSTKMILSDDLGHDDFPNSIKFEVSLQPGRPRAKQDIESMFNSGGGPVSYTALAPPTSSHTSLGEFGSSKMAAYYGNPNVKTDTSTTATATQPTAEDIARAEALAEYFSKNVSRAYGSGFAPKDKGVLTDYFTDLRTKD